MFKSSIQRELDSFFKAVSNSDFKIREVTKGAFTQARAKLNPWAFGRLNEVVSGTFYEDAEYYVWHGMRTLSVDGTRLVLPNHPSIIEEFGQHQFGPKADSPRSLAMGSMLYDVLNQITIDSKPAPYSSSERDLLLQHLDKVKAAADFGNMNCKNWLMNWVWQLRLYIFRVVQVNGSIDFFHIFQKIGEEGHW